MEISVIITTFNHPFWLYKVLLGYKAQKFKDFEIIIADDGSENETLLMIEEFKFQHPQLAIRHLWHEDKGFRKTKILNKAIQIAKHGYLLFTDGDCIPRNDFLSIHAKHAQPNYFLSGGYCKLPLRLSRNITPEDILEQRIFNPFWLAKKGGCSPKILFKTLLRQPFNALLDTITPTKASWNGMNSSTFRKYLYEVNGFNEEMKYGGLDRELGERLFNFGLKGKQIRNRAICLHLNHSREYKRDSELDKNKEIRDGVQRSGLFWCKDGIRK